MCEASTLQLLHANSERVSFTQSMDELTGFICLPEVER
jgi:hypothetical protein